MEIELGLIGAIALMGVAVQLRILKLLQRKLKEIKEEQKRRDAENDSKEAERFARLPHELAEWEKEHPSSPDGKHHWRQNSEFSSIPLMQDSPGTPGTPEPMFARNRNPSETSQLMLAPPYRSKSPGALPALDLGLDIQEDVPKGFMADVGDDTKESASSGSEAKKLKTELEAEISTLRRSIDLLGDSQASSASGSRHPSLTSRRTLSYDLNNAVLPASHLRPPKANEQRSRVQSMELSTLTSSQQAGNSIGRPTSAPLRNQDDWDAYVRDRKILQPPSGPSAPIATTPISMPMPAPAPRLTVPPAVHEALLRRGQREGLLDGEGGAPQVISPVMDAEGAQFLGTSRHRHQRTNSSNVHHNSSSAAVNVLPPRKGSSPTGGSPNGPPHPPRTVTYEELTERHREKLRELQAPLTQAEKEHAELEAAKARWERSKAVEKRAVEKRQAEQVRLNEKKQQQQQRTGGGEEAQAGGNAHSRSPSAGVGRPVTHTKRLSTMKVEDWQRYQSDVEAQRSTQQQQKPSPSRRQSAVPFPDQPRGQQQRPNHERKGSRGLSGVLPPN